MTEQELELRAYRLIRKEVRRFDRDTSYSELANYVRGIVDLQTEIYSDKVQIIQNVTGVSE